MTVEHLLTKYPLISEQVTAEEVLIVLRHLEQVLRQTIPGSVVEFGCYSGTTSLFIMRLLQSIAQSPPFHVYDSFAGLPPKTSLDESPAGQQFKEGALAASKADFIRHFKQANLPLPVIHKQWFRELQDIDVPSVINFAFLDGDYYDSIKTCLHLIEHKLSPGSVIIIDDYQSEALPGVAKAVDEWLTNRPQVRLKIHASLAIITDL